MSTSKFTIDVAPLAINVNFKTVKTRDIAFGYDPFSGDGATTDFTLSAQCKLNGIVVFINGVLAKQGTEGNSSSGLYYLNSTRKKIIFFTAPAGETGSLSADEIVAFYAKA